MSARDGNPCKKCGGREWYSDGHCVACKRARAKQWAAENPEKVKENQRRWVENNGERKRENGRRYASKNRSKLSANARRWEKENPERVKEKDRRQYEKHSEKIRERSRLWKNRNPNRANAQTNNYRTKKTGAGGSYTAAEWLALCEQYEWRCAACGLDTVALTADHVMPVSLGGSSDISNIQPLCQSCNSRKHNRHVDYRTKPTSAKWTQGKLL